MTKISNNKLIRIYTIVAFFILTFVERSAGSVPLQIPHIEYNKGYLLLYFTVFVLVVSLLFKFKKRICAVGVFLFLKCIWDLVPVLLNNSLANSTFWYYFSMVVSMPLIYLVFRRYTGSLRTIINYITIFGILLVVQIIMTAVANGYGFTSSLYKYYLRIPLAHSNIIGMILLAILFLRIVARRRRGIEFGINLIIILGLFLTQSVGSIAFLLGWFVVVQVLDAKKKKNYLKIVLICFLTFLLLGLILVSNSIQIMLFSSTISELNFSKLTSRRTDLWALAIVQWLSNPWVGNGLGITEYDVGVEIISTGVHNIVLDFAVQSGIIGLGLYAAAVVSGLRTRVISEEIEERKGLLVAIFILLAYSMVEVSYFHYAGLFFFWMLMGLYNANTGINA